MNTLRVALNMSHMSVAEKLQKSFLIVSSMTANPTVFATPVPTLVAVGSVVDALQTAYSEAAEGGKVKTALMHDREAAVMNILHQLAAYVEALAGEDESIVHLAAMDVRKPHIQHVPPFKISPTENSGELELRVKARRGSLYKWQYQASPAPSSGAWTDALMSSVSKVTLRNLAAGVYLFRVIFLDGNGEHEGDPMQAAVS